MSDAIPSRPPLRPEEGWRPPSRDFFGGPPPVEVDTLPARLSAIKPFVAAFAETTALPSPADIPDEPVGDVPPEVVFTAGGAIAAPKQARRYASGGVLPAGDLSKAPEWVRNQSGYVIPASHPSLDTFRPLLDKLGPGAGAMVEREMDRARAFEVIARAAVAVAEASEADEVAMWEAVRVLREAVAENRAAIA